MKFLVEPEVFELNGCCNCSTINFGGGGKNCDCDHNNPPPCDKKIIGCNLRFGQCSGLC